MDYRIFKPPATLKDFVECFWVLDSKGDETIPENYFLMADNCAEIIFQYNEGFRNYSSQSARMRFQHSLYAKFEVAENVGFFGVRLYPHAVNMLLNIPSDKVANEVFDFNEMFPIEGDVLADKVYNSTSVSERITFVSSFLLKKSAKFKVNPINYFVEHIIKNNGWTDIGKLQTQSGLSVKQFERRFKAVAGFPPKYFARISRFQGLKNIYCTNKLKTMTFLAYSGNYYDQSHFNREFKEFSGIQPRKYFKFVNNTFENVYSSASQPVNAIFPKFDGYLPCGWFI